METLKINQTFDTLEELEKAETMLCKQYHIVYLTRMPTTIGEKEVFGIESITHFGKRGE